MPSSEPGLPVLAACEASWTTASEIGASGAGVRVEPGRPEELLAEVIALVGDPGRRDSVGRRGPTYCETVLGEKAALDAYDVWVRGLARTRGTAWRRRP